MCKTPLGRSYLRVVEGQPCNLNQDTTVGFLYRFQFKSYLSIAAKRGKALAPRFPQPLCQIGLNLESVLGEDMQSLTLAQPFISV